MNDKYLTVVFNVTDFPHKEVATIVGMPHVSALRWGHAIDELHELEDKLKQLAIAHEQANATGEK